MLDKNRAIVLASAWTILDAESSHVNQPDTADGGYARGMYKAAADALQAAVIVAEVYTEDTEARRVIAMRNAARRGQDRGTQVGAQHSESNHTTPTPQPLRAETALRDLYGDGVD